MAISPDSVFGTAGTTLDRPTQATQKLSDLRRGNWLLSLEREQLASRSQYQSPDMSASTGKGESADGAGMESSLPADAKQGLVSMQTSLSWQKQVFLSAKVDAVSASAEFARDQGATVLKPGASTPVIEADLNNVHIRPVLKYAPVLKLDVATAIDLNSTAEPEVMSSYQSQLGTPDFTGGNETGNYSLRQIHLYSHEGKVQAWIRDAQLDEKSTAAVESALRNDLKKNGWELVGLAINGKKTASLLRVNQQRFLDQSAISAQQ